MQHSDPTYHEAPFSRTEISNSTDFEAPQSVAELARLWAREDAREAAFRRAAESNAKAGGAELPYFLRRGCLARAGEATRELRRAS